jgi:hypothetical protein
MEASVPNGKCGLDKLLCPGSDSPDICPRFKQKCPKNQTDPEASSFRIKVVRHIDFGGRPGR